MTKAMKSNKRRRKTMYHTMMTTISTTTTATIVTTTKNELAWLKLKRTIVEKHDQDHKK
jgi:translation initiation factor 2 gamma subunit (eIF-2gamma)